MLWGWLHGMPEAQPKVGNTFVNSQRQQNSTKGYITVIEGYPRLPVEQKKISPSGPNDIEGLTDSELDRLHIATITAFPKSTEKRVISFGLYGNDSKYTIGAIRNAELAPLYFPGWIARFYVDSSVPPDVLKRLKELEAEIIMMQTTGNDLIAGMFWRFLVADDASIDRFIVRDTDSRLNARDRLAVEEWINSGLPIHSIRDSVWHCHPLNGGMWGGTHGAIQNIGAQMASWSAKSAYGEDMDFLNTDVWPLVENKQMSHDAYCCKQFPNAHSFPSKRYLSYQHVGQVFNHLDEPVQKHIDDIRSKVIDEKCRRHVDWIYG
ncbi:hypothetical protein NSK_005669 [Nannochloropsis salina CCMP1776]|uniref:Uncharacterized protein n=1 Tax=Nannochloropsis salina CCMP1776 TaxID=1027361 RepID=A0A4D9D0C0_9STRA|nr:hypothetical protein NSK_005669 [Nannochloropsis salina CCMP1776]|eukprot:TFJ83045.1 hypothetical protein NSK_005669 [Nannochloropsis salina CCMP1776]